MQCSVGWDWIPPVRDRNMGIWQDVYIEETGPVVIRWPRVMTDLPLPKTSPARIKISAELLNLSAKKIKGSFKIFIGKIRLKRKVVLKPGERKEIVFSPDRYKSLNIPNPRLWWPSGYGKPNLYSLLMEFVAGGKLSDLRWINFGIREISTRVVYVKGWARRDFFVNGRRLFIRGGAWVPDMMLRRSPERIKKELRLIKEANLNLVRIWGGGVTPPEEFFDACDRLGLLVWHDFWITGDCQGTWGKGSRDWPLESEVFLENARDVVLRLRNHTSLLVWSAGNEGYPGKRIYIPLRDEIIARLDGTRPFLPSTGFSTPPRQWGLSLPDNKPSGVYSGGPYTWVKPETYFEKVKEGRDWVFKDEVGTPSMISLKSASKFINDFIPDPSFYVPFFNEQWRYHFALYHLKGIKAYGIPQTLQDFVLKAQLMGANAYRAIFEAVNTEPQTTSGVMLWKLNPAWPEFRWQIYDYYLKPIPAYYFVKKAASPLHLQLDLKDYQVGVINHTVKRRNIRARVRVFTSELGKVMDETVAFSVEAEEYRPLLSLKEVLKKGFHFVKLELLDSEGKAISDNFYWISRERDFTPLEKISRAQLRIKTWIENKGRAGVKLKNTSDTLAFFLGLSLLKGKEGEEILPAFWSDNYFSLLPGEEKTVRVKFDEKTAGENHPYLLVEGWNVYPLRINLKTGESIQLKPEISQMSREKGNLCVVIKNTETEGKMPLSFPLWIKPRDGSAFLTHVGLRPGETRKICFLINPDRGG